MGVRVNKSAMKRQKQDEKRRLRNKAYKSFVKTLTKKFLAEEDPEKKKDLLNKLYKYLDRAAVKRIYHPNTVARKKSKLALVLNKSSQNTSK
ncbi:MAG TPA: 30S ribosomal protein S20 [Candidatus Hydrothermia bacterium]|nr:30S ribosomal protein S20 [Candidatus Hydrothermae bacterium]MDD3649704.1 30S ribosomal protein S20 [Candidatus Hydrothermia bacterium]MDD5573314.1 30S ribosomal protein S20 [Candidatus Hydrothermia bacterium]HOK23602.1 30S ribosomal protein S20 [Candidatus Hydrothermia bacterium]HOL24348.1 30S ribosomal protein S20 [Candidatus Hydrothermia bacterium]